MSNTVIILGESGSGKSSSLRNLNPAENFVINIINKPLPFRHFKKDYLIPTKENPEKGNYAVTDNYIKILKLIDAVNERRLDIKNLIIDDFQYLMCNEFMRRVSERGYDKFSEIGQHAWGILNNLMICRDDLNCYVLSHNDLGDNGKMKMKTIGKMLDDKVTLEGMFTTILHTVFEDGKYKFLTQADGHRIAKSPQGMFSDLYIDNDLKYVNEKILEYYNNQAA